MDENGDEDGHGRDGGREGDDLERAREQLEAAREGASRVVRLELESIRDGVYEEDEGDLTKDEPGPKLDRIAEMAEKLDGLADEAEGKTSTTITDARDRLRSYLEEQSGAQTENHEVTAENGEAQTENHEAQAENGEAKAENGEAAR